METRRLGLHSKRRQMFGRFCKYSLPIRDFPNISRTLLQYGPNRKSVPHSCFVTNSQTTR
jgi:hypothetical protein